MTRLNSVFWCLFLVFCLISSEPYASEGSINKKSAKKHQIISSQEAVKQAKQKTGGKVLGVKLQHKGNKSTYKVRVLTDKKRVKNVSINAKKPKNKKQKN